MNSDWESTRRRILRRDRTETITICVVAAVAGPAALIMLLLGDSHPGVTQFVGGAAIMVLMQASIAGLFPERTSRAFQALTAPDSRVSTSPGPRTRYAHSPTLRRR